MTKRNMQNRLLKPMVRQAQHQSLQSRLGHFIGVCRHGRTDRASRRNSLHALGLLVWRRRPARQW